MLVSVIDGPLIDRDWPTLTRGLSRPMGCPDFDGAMAVYVAPDERTPHIFAREKDGLFSARSRALSLDLDRRLKLSFFLVGFDALLGILRVLFKCIETQE